MNIFASRVVSVVFSIVLCLAPAITQGQPCIIDEDCDDFDPSTLDQCVLGECVFVPSNSATIVIQDATDAGAQQLGLSVCQVFVEFNDPLARLISVDAINITTTDPNGFHQNPLGGNTAPDELIIQTFPEVAYDSYVTIGLSSAPSDAPDGTRTNPDFSWTTNAITGGWHNNDPTNGQGDPDGGLRVQIGQFTVGAGESTSGNVTIFVQGDFGAPVIDCTADLNGDGSVDGADELLLLTAWGPCLGCPEDLNGDGVVNQEDLSILLSRWGPCVQPSLPLGQLSMPFECTAPPVGQPWIESGDAGNLPSNGQPVQGCGPIVEIQGVTDASQGDHEDIFFVHVPDPDVFGVSTSPDIKNGFASFDTQIFVFDENGNGIAANDDCPFGVGLQSCIVDIGPSGLNLMTQPGFYWIAISGYDDDPSSIDGPIFDQNPFNEITGPDGIGGFMPIVTWDSGGATGDYIMALNGTNAITATPEDLLEPPCTDCKDALKTAPCLCEEGRLCGGPVSLGNPVYLFSGECYQSEVDMRIKGRGLDFIWARKYRSRIGPDTEMGNRWDYSYNMRVEPCGTDMRVYDGNSRQDTYTLQPDGTWAMPGFFRSLAENPDNSFTLTFEDTGTWNFHPLGHPDAAGRISSIVDRNGNALTFNYDGQGRLTTIHDTLDTAGHNRDITISYNANGFIEAVTDFTGRSVTYDYYDGIEPGGSFGDLKSVTTPIVIGTPHGNDFPSGKTTVYTYTTGFADDTLNHDLLTITDAKGQAYLQIEYAHTIGIADPRSTQDPADFHYDRVVRQVWGSAGDTIDLNYAAVIPSVANNFAETRTIVNDRVGNVTELYYNTGNLCVMEREFTGRAPDPDAVTTAVANRPTGQLRAGDPAFFETRWEYNADALPTRIISPNGNEETLVYDDGNASPRSRGNLLQHCRLPGTHLPPGDQAQICESFTYDEDFGGCCGTNFVTTRGDGKGNQTQHTYDTNGNRTQTVHRIPNIVEDFEYNAFGQLTAHVLPDNGSGHRRRDERTYHTSGPQMGYLKEETVDAGNFSLTTTYEYDAVGNMTRMIDPRGNDTQFEHNALDQVVRQLTREVTDGSGIRYEKLTFHDANNNIIRIDVENRDETGAIQPNTHYSTIFEFEILNHVTRTCSEVGNLALTSTDLDCTSMPQGESIFVECEYDPNRNRTLLRYGEATNGNQPNNALRTLFDERDLVFRTIRAQGDVDQSSVQFDYDGNQNPVQTTQGLESASPRSVTSTFDGYDRRIAETDAMGNVTTVTYDANHNRTSTIIQGEIVDVPGSAANVRLAETTFRHDAMDRLTRTEMEHFVTGTQAAIGDGQAVTQAIYSDSSQITQVIDDNNHSTFTTYDTANRRSLVTDHKGNAVSYGYDANSNITAVTETDKSDGLNPDQVFVTSTAFDNLDRRTQSIDNVGNTIGFAYDSRGNLTALTDALTNTSRRSFDGMNRLVSIVRDLDGDGPDGDGDDISTSSAWDDSSRLVGRTDDNGNTTSTAFDALGRPVVQTFADGTMRIVSYDVHDNPTSMTDANGSVTTCTFDLNNRLTGKAITPGAGVSSNTTFEQYKHDGRSRVVEATDDDAVLTRQHDSLSNTTQETLNGQATTSVFDGVGNKVQCTYPGGRVITTTFDELNRKQVISDGSGLIASYNYIGGRVERRDNGNGTRTDFEYDGVLPNPVGDFGVRQIIGTTHSVIGTGEILDARSYRWDRMQNKMQRKDTRVGGPQLTHDYGYDPTYRLVSTTVTDASAIVIRNTGYDLDGVANRESVTGSPDAGLYGMDGLLPDPADHQMNQYTATPTDLRHYDDNGNLVSFGLCLSGDADEDGTFSAADTPAFVAALLGTGPVACGADVNRDEAVNGLDIQPFLDQLIGLVAPAWENRVRYDYRNQMVEFENLLTGERHRYGYDPFGRRISRIVDADGVANGPTETRYYHDALRVCEEQNTGGVTKATYVYGRYIDEVLNMQRGGVDYYYHADDLYNVVALTDATGNVIERYEYADYGQPLDPSSLAPISGNPSAVGNPYLFTGRRFDPETGWYYYRLRYLDPVAGRFSTRDPIGIWGDSANAGNGYTYAGSNPWTKTDPLGLDGGRPQYGVFDEGRHKRPNSDVSDRWYSIRKDGKVIAYFRLANFLRNDQPESVVMVIIDEEAYSAFIACAKSQVPWGLDKIVVIKLGPNQYATIGDGPQDYLNFDEYFRGGFFVIDPSRSSGVRFQRGRIGNGERTTRVYKHAGDSGQAQLPDGNMQTPGYIRNVRTLSTFVYQRVSRQTDLTSADINDIWWFVSLGLDLTRGDHRDETGNDITGTDLARQFKLNIVNVRNTFARHLVAYRGMTQGEAAAYAENIAMEVDALVSMPGRLRQNGG